MKLKTFVNREKAIMAGREESGWIEVEVNLQDLTSQQRFAVAWLDNGRTTFKESGNNNGLNPEYRESHSVADIEAIKFDLDKQYAWMQKTIKAGPVIKISQEWHQRRVAMSLRRVVEPPRFCLADADFLKAWEVAKTLATEANEEEMARAEEEADEAEKKRAEAEIEKTETRIKEAAEKAKTEKESRTEASQWISLNGSERLKLMFEEPELGAKWVAVYRRERFAKLVEPLKLEFQERPKDVVRDSNPSVASMKLARQLRKLNFETQYVFLDQDVEEDESVPEGVTVMFMEEQFFFEV